MEKLKILIVDDDEPVLDSFQLFLSDEFDVITAVNNKQAFYNILDAKGSIRVAIIDMMMGNDAEAGLILINELNELPVLDRPVSIVLTGHGDIKNAAKCMEAGAFSYVSKGKEETQDLLKQAILRGWEYKKLSSIPKISPEVSDVLNGLIEARNSFEYRHSKHICQWSLAVLEEMDEEFHKNKLELQIAASFCNLGKARLPDNIMDKPGAFTPEEWVEYKKYPEYSYEIIRTAFEKNFSPSIENGIRYHCERLDGSGFPNRIQGASIPLLARILNAVSDYSRAFSPRYNRGMRGIEKALRVVSNSSKYDKEVINALEKAYKKGELCKNETERSSDKLFIAAEEMIKNKQYEQAQKSCEQAISAISKDSPFFQALFYVGAGDLLFNSNEIFLLPKAVDYYTKAIYLRPAFAEAYYKRGLAFQRQSMWEQADADFSITVAIIPTYIEAHLAQGEVRYQGGYYLDAETAFDYVVGLIGDTSKLSLDTNSLHLRYLQACAYYRKGINEGRKNNKPADLMNFQTALEICYSLQGQLSSIKDLEYDDQLTNLSKDLGELKALILYEKEHAEKKK